ncbi:MAG: PKD domain-containing protein [Bacteroidota bacterium]
MQTIQVIYKGFLAGAFLCLLACSSTEEEIVIEPTAEDAQFTVSVDPENPNLLTFTADPQIDTWYTHWDFGDNTAAEGPQAEKTYFVAGEYQVRFKVFTEGGTAESYQTVTIAEDLLGGDLVTNGGFDSADGWEFFTISGGAEVVIENGAATWSGGGWGNVGIYQVIEAEANVVYQINMDIAGSGMTDCWFEVYIGTIMPQDGVDYTDGGIRLGLNTWDGCGAEPFDGVLSALSCSNGGGDGTFTFAEDTSAFLVIRSGGADLGAEGVTIDNLTIRGQ